MVAKSDVVVAILGGRGCGDCGRRRTSVVANANGDRHSPPPPLLPAAAAVGPSVGRAGDVDSGGGGEGDADKMDAIVAGGRRQRGGGAGCEGGGSGGAGGDSGGRRGGRERKGMGRRRRVAVPARRSSTAKMLRTIRGNH